MGHRELSKGALRGERASLREEGPTKGVGVVLAEASGRGTQSSLRLLLSALPGTNWLL